MEQTRIGSLSYWSIRLDSLRLDTTIDFDLYIQSGSDLTLYRSASEPFTEQTREKLIENGITTLFTPLSQRSIYQKYIEAHMAEIMKDVSIDGATKASLAYDTSQMLVRDVLAKPTLGENIQRSQNMVAASVDFILNDKDAFANLLKVMSFDYQTYTHSVNVCTFSIALAKFIGIDGEEALNNLGVGALLHDVGKTKIPEEILNKKSALDDEEFELIKEHPIFGLEILRQTGLIHEDCYLPVGQHHEREDGSGYPYGLKSADIHEYSKIVGIADVFDAMTTQRSYRNAVETFPCLMVMYGDKQMFDQRILEQFTILMGPRKLVEI